MKLLITQSHNHHQLELLAILNENMVEYDIFKYESDDAKTNNLHENKNGENIDFRKYDAVLSIDYCSELSDRCLKNGIKYIVIFFDYPYGLEKCEDTLGNEINYIFVFDRILYDEYRKKGFNTIFYMPLGVHSSYLSRLKFFSNEGTKFDSEVSYYGKIMGSNLMDRIKNLDSYAMGYINSLIDIQGQIYGVCSLKETITEELIEQVNMHLNSTKYPMKLGKNELAYLISGEIVQRDLLIMLKVLSKRFSTIIYTDEKELQIENAIICEEPESQNYLQCFQIYAKSKVNMNRTAPIIQSGITPKCLEIMGAGGFLLTNYENEIVEYYNIDEELVVYESVEDAIEKACFYLKNEPLRERIAQKGREKTLEEMNLQHYLENLLQVVKL